MTRYRSFRLGPEPEGSRKAWLLFPLLGLFVATVLLFFVVFRPGAVEGSSMEPALHAQERFLGTRDYSAPSRGDVVVFDVRDPDDRSVQLVKRVVAIPGDTVYAEGDAVWVNGERDPTHGVDSGEREPVFGPLTLDGEHVFVAGDNRPLALDSRRFGPVPRASIRSRVIAVFWPPHRVRLVR
ncbi:MAG: signal peptidase I [Coriobacteriia bacterium]|nr:signal peptidase I [Coriobacteriia bacterium]